MQRRKFMKEMAVGSAAIMISPALLAMENSLKSDASQLGGLTPFILFEDCVKLIVASDQFSENFKNALRGEIRKPLYSNVSRLAGVFTNSNDQIFNLLSKLAITTDKNDLKWHDEKLSFALGWIINRALAKDIVTYNQKLVRNNHNIEEIRAYQDAWIIRTRFGKAEASALKGEDVSSLMMEYILRVITRIHTLTPDIKDGGAWIIRLSDWREQNVKTYDLYGSAFSDPDPIKQNLYVKKCNFYSIDDPLIANHFQVNDLTGRNNCLYSKALLKGFNALSAVQAFMNGKGDIAAVRRLV